MVLKMLYNWDDMHIFAFAFPEKKTSRWQQQLSFLGEAESHEQQDAAARAASLSLHSFSIRFTFSHNAVGHQTSGACASKRPLSVTPRV